MAPPTVKRRPSTETREHVLEIAYELFYWHGIRAIGVDRIAAEAGIAPTTLYRLFPSKDDLVASYLERTYRNYRTWFTEAVQAGGEDPRQRILAVFDSLVEQVQPGRCRGCPFLMALSEFPDKELLAHEHAVATKQWVRTQFGELTQALAASIPVEDPAALADHLTLIMEGVYASVQALGSDGPITHARSLVEAVLPAKSIRGRPARPRASRPR